MFSPVWPLYLLEPGLLSATNDRWPVAQLPMHGRPTAVDRPYIGSCATKPCTGDAGRDPGVDKIWRKIRVYAYPELNQGRYKIV